MPANSWRNDDLYNELEPISSLVSDLSDSDDVDSYFYRGLGGRRRKAAVMLTVIWSGTIALHLVSWGYWFVICFTAVLGLHALRVLTARPLPASTPANRDNPEDYPSVSLLVAAKNEEAVIENLVRALCDLDYPSDRYDLWIINDNSSDRTPQILDRLASEYQQLHVIHRGADASGGKSGALNQARSLSQGEILAVFDADAQVPKDLLRQVVPLFDRDNVGAVQVRKAISQAQNPLHPEFNNFWIKGQAGEMIVDAYIQQQRVAIGGIGELRGNGQFVRRAALDSCGGWNEETITDDLDLTIRLHLDHWDVDVLFFPPVGEEGVTSAIGLWHQRNRWGEGGYQRYLDYWRLIVRNRMGTRKTADLLLFWVTQYFLSAAAIPDFLMAILRHRFPVMAPIATLTVGLSVVGMYRGIRQIRGHQIREGKPQDPNFFSIATLLQSVRGTMYMCNWFVVLAWVTFRMSIRPKQLKWVKTVHHGEADVWVDASH